MIMNNLSFREKILLTLAAVLLAACLTAEYVVIPEYKKLDDEEQKLKKNSMILQNLEYYKIMLPSLNSDNEQLLSNYKILSSSVPDSPKLDYIVSDISSTLSTVSCTLHSINFGSSQNYNAGSKADKNTNPMVQLIVQPISISVEGSFCDVQKFIFLLENNKRKIIIKNITMESNTDNNLINAIIRCECFYFDGEKAASKRINF